ncbi:transposase [Pseudomonas savastanoi pv. savastanoi NCPPB 3335]|uniref:Transposase n=1 Tax=Pseudomonas savastanoi pv. savastanoi NCPPB 3335 TaxID=693985 RepID=A0ABC8BA61_PSESS|nr:transposase [Pseudomonas savastanoi pv. savastanoi NCPPB 3335]
MKKLPKYSPEVRERAIRMVFEHLPEFESQWATISAIAPKIGCTPETLRLWVRQSERNSGQRDGLSTVENASNTSPKLEAPHKRQANEILRKASAYFAQAELDRPFKR